ncbi:MAG: NapC/NirT family cytochrome c [Magnetococcales bacterium]|nr:NapC/NirT family cytochrome c [Magnetococcales bacterium]MBF0437553.1 NapC/NirT family cytochrome c [Magnetococcales bacterium]
MWPAERSLFSRWSSTALVGVGALSMLVFLIGFNHFLDHTNTLEFCISCHEMETTVYKEYLESPHYKNPSGVRATCPDCHVPKPFWPKMVRKVMALNDIYHTIKGSVDTPEKFNAKRKEMAERVWATMVATDSRECRSCHDLKSMKFEEQRPRAQTKHPEAIQEGKTCIDCHHGVAHRAPPRDD